VELIWFDLTPQPGLDFGELLMASIFGTIIVLMLAEALEERICRSKQSSTSDK